VTTDFGIHRFALRNAKAMTSLVLVAGESLNKLALFASGRMEDFGVRAVAPFTALLWFSFRRTNLVGSVMDALSL
jgi:hypothetical protein